MTTISVVLCFRFCRIPLHASVYMARLQVTVYTERSAHPRTPPSPGPGSALHLRLVVRKGLHPAPLQRQILRPCPIHGPRDLNKEGSIHTTHTIRHAPLHQSQPVTHHDGREAAGDNKNSSNSSNNSTTTTTTNNNYNNNNACTIRACRAFCRASFRGVMSALLSTGAGLRGERTGRGHTHTHTHTHTPSST
jgi:hypothetical protein